KAGIAMLGSDLTHEMIDDQTYWFSASIQPIAEPCQSAFLLPTYDEFLVGYAGFDRSRRAGQAADKVSPYDSTIVIGGQVVGTWRRTFSKEAAVIELAPFVPLTDAQHEAIRLAAQRYSAFIDM